jgi:plastocyanin
MVRRAAERRLSCPAIDPAKEEHRMRRSLIAVVLLAVVAASCGGDDGEDGGAATGATTSGATATGGAATGTTGDDCVDLSGEGGVFSITISGLAFDPSCFTASASQGISIENQDGVAHTFTIDDTQIDVEIPPGETFNGEPIAGVVEPGTYAFHCRIHPSMTGEVTVVA